MTQHLTVGVIGKSLKENEKRVAIHPEHVKRIPQRLRKQITFEDERRLHLHVSYPVILGTGTNTLFDAPGFISVPIFK